MSAKQHNETEQLAELQSGLALKPHEVPLNRIIPLLVPANFFASQQWPGPYTLLRSSGLAITWVVLMPKQTMLYVTHKMAEHWQGEKLDWKQKATENLARATGEQVATSQFAREDGQPYALVMMQEDGFGPSRLLLTDQLARRFPEGYRVAVPEMSVGLAFSARLSEVEQKKMENLVRNCFEKGTRPASPLIHESFMLVPA